MSHMGTSHVGQMGWVSCDDGSAFGTAGRAFDNVALFRAL
jgi:hypothetical protein